MVDVRAFVKVEQPRFGRPAEQVPGELQHIVGVAALAGLLGDVLRYGARPGEIFPVGIAADDVAVVPRHRFPEEAGGVRIGRIARQRVQAGRSEERRVWTECASTCRSRWSPYLGKHN